MPLHPITQLAKAWVALAGAVAVALLGVYAADSTVGQVLTVVAVVATAVATYTVPNAPTVDAHATGGEIEGTH